MDLELFRAIFSALRGHLRITQLKSELRDAERRQSGDICRQREEITRLGSQVTLWGIGDTSQP